MKIFISWSGERSLALAEALRGWLPLVLHYVEPWLSKADIDAGKRWDDELSKTLSECNFGISCVTPDNLLAPWLLFEAGALAKSVESGNLVPLLLDMDLKDFSGPLSRFQAKKVDKAGISEVLAAINKAAAAPIPEERLTALVEMAWDKLAAMIDAIPASGTVVKKTRTQSDILEELVSGVRSVESRVRDLSDYGDGPRKRRFYKWSPRVMHEMMDVVQPAPDDPLQIVIVSSMLRDDFPWLYEIGMLAYRAVVAREVSDADRLLRTFERGLKLLTHGSFGREFAHNDERVRMLIMEMEFMFGGSLADRFGVSPPPRRKRPPAKLEAGG